jgi:purine-binding chemotaxis protein CheW
MTAPRSLVTFKVDGLRFGIDVARVQEVLRASTNTRVPLAPQVLGGLVNLRGEIVVALDMRRRLGLPDAPPDAQRMNLVVRTPDGPVSLIVDEIGEVMEPTEDQFERVPETLRGPVRRYAEGVVKASGGPLLFLNVERAIDMRGS